MAQEGGVLCIIMTDMSCFMKKPTQHCKLIIFQFKNKINKINMIYIKKILKKRNKCKVTLLHMACLQTWEKFLSWSQSVFYCWSKFIGQGVNIPKLMNVSLALSSARREARLHALVALSKLDNGGRSQTPGTWLLGP